MLSKLSTSFSLLNQIPLRTFTQSIDFSNWTEHEGLKAWIKKQVDLMQPERVHLCDGSAEERDMLNNAMVLSGTFIPVPKRPGSYYARSHPADVARVEGATLICSKKKEDAGPSNNWKDPDEMRAKLRKLYKGVMKGRTMYVIPFSMAPVDSPFSQIGVEITDSPYVVNNMRIMTHGMGKESLNALGTDKNFIPCLHTVGMPLKPGQQDVPWPCNPKEKWIVHFPETKEIMSYGSGYGGNALLGKKCFALRIASKLAKEQGWLAEHMLILGITAPWGKKYYVTGAFPSACGKTNLAMLKPSLPGWKIQTVGDDICWMRIGEDGRLYGVNPEAGFFGVAPGTSFKSNPNCMKALTKNTIFTNTALTPDGDVWWEGMTKKCPKLLSSWLRKEHYPDSKFKAAHPNARFTAPVDQIPTLDPDWKKPEGVPISAILFGGRRSTTVPLVFQSKSWEHGVFLGATMNSETTAATTGKMGVLRNDPFAMKPFCGYNMADYWAHWLSFKHRTAPSALPKIFHVNWFRKGKNGKYLWPGYGDNVRALEWILKRCDGEGEYTDTPIGYVPAKGAINTEGLDLDEEKYAELMKIDLNEWKENVQRSRKFFKQFGSKLPKELDNFAKNLQQSIEDKL